MPAVVSALIYEISYWGTFFVWMIGFRMRVYGREHFPRRGPVLVVANHESLLDPIAPNGFLAISCCLINRGKNCAGSRIRPGAGMQRQRFEIVVRRTEACSFGAFTQDLFF